MTTNASPSFCLNLLAPPAIASTLIVIGVCLYTLSVEVVALWPLMLVVAYLYAGLPSLAHALILRRCYRRG